jgi:hypothetical protein
MPQWRKVGIEESERMGRSDNSNSFSQLRLSNLLMQLFHFGPVHLGPEMMFGVVPIIKPQQIVPLGV